MRLRNIPRAEGVLKECSQVIETPEEFRDHWASDVFQNDYPVHIEIGMGKGRFLMALAQKNPQINYIGIERYTSVLLRAVQKREQLPTEEALPNLLYLCIDASELPEIFAKDEVAKIYLNFSDPWPKDRHAKRRLTSKEYWARYDRILCPEGRVIFKTDNRPLFDFSLEQVEVAGWQLDNYTFDLHHSEYAEGNVMTEYEERFTAKGNPICRLVAHRDPQKKG